MIFQDPLSSLHPFYTVGAQIAEAYLVHNHVGKKAARSHAIDMLGRVGLPADATARDPSESMIADRPRSRQIAGLISRPRIPPIGSSGPTWFTNTTGTPRARAASE